MPTDGSSDKPTNGEWRKTTVGEAAPFVYGKGLPRGKRNESGIVPVYGSNGIIGYHDTPLTDKPTIIVGRKGTIGTVHYSPVPCWPIDTTFYICDDARDDIRFRYYALKCLGLERMNSDTAVPGLNRNAAHAQELSLPPLSTQRAISRVLGAFDDKIALNAEMNATLEAMARALFRAWFVDFEPVRAKQAGRWRRGQTLPGMPAELYDIFPAELTATLGDAPAGWGIGAFGDIVSQSLDKEKPFESPDTVFNHFSIPAYNANKMPTLDKGSTIKSVKSIVKPDTLLLSRLNPQIPRVWLVDVAEGERAVCSTEFMVLSAKAPFRRNYIYFLGQTEHFHTQLQSLVTGTIHQRSRAHEILRIQTLLPDASILKAFDELVADFMSRAHACLRESISLAAMRDTLLPRLLSGEVRVE